MTLSAGSVTTIDGQGHVRITDFGIAALVSEVNREVSIVGTPAYMAPELFHGERPSVQSDIFSLGAVHYELVTGSPIEAVVRASSQMP